MKIGQKSAFLLAFAVIGAVITPSSASGYDRDTPSLGWVAAGVGLTAACVYGLCSWLRPSDEQVANQAAQVLHDTSKIYAPFMRDMAALLEVDLVVLSNFYKARYVAVIREEHLQQLARTYVSNAHHYPEYLSRASLISHSATLKQQSDYLRERVARKNVEYAMRDRMNYLIKALHELRAKIDMLAGFFADHEEYFRMEYAKKKFIANYHDLIASFDMYKYDQVALMQYVRVCIARDSDAKYPYMTYIDRLDRAIAALKTPLASTYICQYNQVSELIQNTKTLRALIVADDMYAQERQHKQLMELEEERNRALQRQARAQEEQAAAQFMQAQAQRDQANAQYMQAQAQREQVYVQERQARALEVQNHVQTQQVYIQARQLQEQQEQVQAQERQARAQELQALAEVQHVYLQERQLQEQRRQNELQEQQQRSQQQQKEQEEDPVAFVGIETDGIGADVVAV